MTPQEKNKLILATVLSFAIITPLMLLPALLPLPAPTAVPPMQVVAQLDHHARSANWEAVDALFDYRAKGEVMLPDLWAQGNEKARSGLIELLQGIFQRSWKKGHDTDIFDDAAVSETYIAPDRAYVTQMNEERGEGFRYWLKLTDGQWRIVDRTTIANGSHYEPSGIVRSIRRRIAGDLGHEPDLQEFVDNAPTWLGQVHRRRIIVK